MSEDNETQTTAGMNRANQAQAVLGKSTPCTSSRRQLQTGTMKVQWQPRRSEESVHGSRSHPPV